MLLFNLELAGTVVQRQKKTKKNQPNTVVRSCPSVSGCLESLRVNEGCHPPDNKPCSSLFTLKTFKITFFLYFCDYMLTFYEGPTIYVKTTASCFLHCYWPITDLSGGNSLSPVAIPCTLNTTPMNPLGQMIFLAGVHFCITCSVPGD